MSAASPDSELIALCARLRPVLRAADFTESAVRDRLGDAVFGCLTRGEPGPVHTAAGGDPLGTLIRLFLAAAATTTAAAAAALAPVTVGQATAAGLLEPDPRSPAERVRAALSLRPATTPGGAAQWLISDLDGLMRPHPQLREHVLGVGHASVSLLRATPLDAVGTVLDLGSGCGIQACAAATHAESVTATDVSARAAVFTAASAALCGVDVEVLTGSWFGPLGGRRFDLIVANPPFVVGRAQVEHTYRDSGLDLDGASELVVREAPDHLAAGGRAVLLASWVHRPRDSWQARVASWLPDEGVRAWVLQRDVADPALYVGTWVRDEGLDPRVGAGREKSDAWLAHLSGAGVSGVGFGFVFLQAIDGPSEVVCEELTQAFDDPLGAEAAAHFDRMAALDGIDLGASRPQLAPDVALERVSVPDAGAGVGWSEVVLRVSRMSGPRFSHEIDADGARLLAGCSGALTLDDLVALLEAGTGTEGRTESAHHLIADLARHGFVTLL